MSECSVCGEKIPTASEWAKLDPRDRDLYRHIRCNSFIHASDLRRIIREEVAAALRDAHTSTEGQS